MDGGDGLAHRAQGLWQDQVVVGEQARLRRVMRARREPVQAHGRRRRVNGYRFAGAEIFQVRAGVRVGGSAARHRASQWYSMADERESLPPMPRAGGKPVGAYAVLLFSTCQSATESMQNCGLYSRPP